MKVTVCFGPVRVIVPCGDGEILVKDLIRQAVHRYKKATGKGSDNWVAVHSLQTQRDGGILDPDDRLHDVADDREQIIANFGEGEGAHHGGGDGASGSSVGTSSPDIFQGGEKFQTDIEVTNEQIASGIPGPLQVRRGSEPALNQLVPNNGVATGSNGHCVGVMPPPPSNDASKRWSAAPIITEPRDRPPGRKDDRTGGHHHMNGYEDKWRTHLEEEEPVALRPPQAFARDGSNRLSMQFFGDNGYRWCDAADRVMLHNRMQSLSLPREHKRREPLGQAHNSPQPPDCELREGTEYIVLDTGGGSLGLHVVPDYDGLGRERGLLVQGVEPGGRVDADGRLNVNDRIIEINGNNLIQQPFNVVQEIFRDSLRSQELRLRVVKGSKGPSNSSGTKKQPPPPVFPKPLLTQERAEPINMVEGEERCVGLLGSKMAMTRKVPVSGASLQTGNTRKLGRKVEISLVKGQYGLGFSVTTRDNPAGGNAPIYIKNILPKGAAVEDGRLRPGDRLLAVDGTDLSGKTQADVVAILRNVPPGASVTLLVSRQADSPHSPNASISLDGMNTPPESLTTPLPNNINKTPDKEIISNHISKNSTDNNSDDSCVYPWRQREIITLDIPVHDSEKAGLGVSVKGKTSSTSNSSGNVANSSANSSSSVDLGIFVKNVIHGGAASRDGRLKTNDQLLNVNGISLLGQSNASAMETLRRALLRTDGPVPGAITITIARKLAHRSESVSSLLTDSSANTETFGCKIDDSPGNAENSGASENSDNTVIFKPPYSKSQIENSSVRNPLIERIANQNNITHLANPLRNESYYRATHQTSMILNNAGQLISPTVNMSPPDTVIIEDEENSPYMANSNNNQPRHPENDKNNPSSQQRNSTSSTQTADITYASQLSLDEGGGFSRDAFGRQSMSEKRHAALDAKNTDTYQRNKKAREEREKAKKEGNNNDIKTQLGPSLGMKKSSSLESLQTMVQEMQMNENEETNYRGGQSGARIVRGRGCNESFRAAVDRLDPLAEDDGDSPLGRQPSLNTSLESKSSKGSKKKPSLLRGIGSMFRFGKTRKEVGSGGGNASGGGTTTTSAGTVEDEREAARRAARDEQLRIQEQYRKLVQKQSEFQQHQQQQQQNLHHNQETQHHQQQQQQQQSQQQTTQSIREESEKPLYGSMRMDEPSRTERINQLRLEHQRRHQERRGLYPLEDTEERYEHHIKQRLENGELDNAVTMNRPGSRVGISDPSRFSHYVNYHEIQQHLKEEIAAVKLRKSKSQTTTNIAHSSDESRRQQHYHSQRQVSREQVHRPVSNFYEYESVQAVLRAQAMAESNSLPRRPDMPSVIQGQHISNGGYNIVGSHHQQLRYSQMAYPTTHAYHHYNNNSRSSYGKTPGPFVTHVTIRETQPNV